MKRSTVLRSAFGATMAAAMACSAPAMAMDAKQCLPMAEMNAALKAEGQRTMIIGDRLSLRNDAQRDGGLAVDEYANAVTSNADGSIGYQLEGDRSRSQTSTSMCVAAKLTNVRIFDAARSEIPQQALLGGKMDDMLRADAKVGARPMVVADTVHRAKDGTERIGLPMVLTGNVPARVGAIYARKADGEPLLLVRLGTLDYTPAGLERARGTALAALDVRGIAPGGN